LLVLCDCGGSNGNRQLRFKEDLSDLAYELRRPIEVAHYPPSCSKFNPIERRLFCHVTRALQGVVLRTIHVARDFIANTTTTTGLKVAVEIARKIYYKGRKATDDFLNDFPVRSWQLPIGLVDLMAFPDDSRLLLARNERADKRSVFRLRNLLGDKPLVPLAEINDFPAHVFDGVMSRDGNHWTLDGLRSVKPWVRSIRTYDDAGREIYGLSIDKTDQWGAFVLDSADKKLAKLPTGTSRISWRPAPAS
jgi:hypothetical protein